MRNCEMRWREGSVEAKAGFEVVKGVAAGSSVKAGRV